MSQELTALTLTAATIGFFHTLLGPDHYLPFIVMAKARNWTMARAFTVTFLCGVGHIMSSVALGFLGIGLGMAVHSLVEIESFRGELAAWFLIGFGFTYMVWGIRKAMINRPHSHAHVHGDRESHIHLHSHGNDHLHLHHGERKNLTPWILFTIFLFGPCEPLIPILMYPAATETIGSVIWIAAIFGSVTIGTMLTIVLGSLYGFQFLPMKGVERYMHALAGATIFLCGLSIRFLGL